MKFNKMTDIPEAVMQIIKTLNNNHHQAYIVGGSVRDMILGKPAHDWDITTDATPQEVTKIFEAENIRVIPTGEAFGTVMIHLNDEDYEVTTFRLESNYEDFRRPTAVSFSKSIEEDLARRDFSINAMAFSPITNELIDPFGGQEDLKNGVIKAVGRPEERFREDALRLMRAIRFASRYGFEIDEDTKHAIKRNADRIRYVSAERVKKEIDGILMSSTPSIGVQLLHDLGLLKIIIPEVDILDEVPQASKWHSKNVWGHTLDVIDGTPANLDVRWTTLLHDIGKEKARVRDETGRDRFIGHDKISGELSVQVMKRLKFDNTSIQKISRLIYLHGAEPEKRNKLKHFLRHLGAENLENWHEMRQADIKAHHPDTVEHGIQGYLKRKAILDDILAKGEPYAISHLNIDGNDLIAFGIPAGPIIGKILRELLNLVIINPNKNNKAFLKSWAINNWRRIRKENEIQ